MFLSNIDMLSPPITLYYKRKKIHPSAISGVLTIISYLLILSYTIYYFQSYINRENPTAYSFNRYVNDAGNFSLKDSSFFNYIQISEGRERKVKEFDFNKLEIIGINVSIDAFKSFRGEYPIAHWVYGKCDSNIDNKGLGYLLNNETFNYSACIKKLYNPYHAKYYDIDDENFEWPIINQGASNPNFKFYGVVIKKCQNTSLRLRFFHECDSEEEINKYINNVFLSFTILDHYVDVLNYKDPITKFLYTITNGVNSFSYSINNLNFNPGLIKTFDNLFVDKIKEQTTYFFHENGQTSQPTNDTNLLGAFFIWLQNSQHYYERRYAKLQDALPGIGGFGSVIMMIAKCINYFVSRFTMLADTKQLISHVLNENQTIYEKMKKSSSL